MFTQADMEHASALHRRRLAEVLEAVAARCERIVGREGAVCKFVDSQLVQGASQAALIVDVVAKLEMGGFRSCSG